MADALNSDEVGPWARLISETRKEIPSVRACVSRDWGLASARPIIRQSITECMTELSEADRTMLADLNEPPRLQQWCVSISHTAQMGGWFAVRRPSQIGWDVENKARIKPEIVKRVSEAREAQDAPHFAFLWPAKEAFFKALEDEQPEIISALTITQWHALGSGLWRWEGLGPRNAIGLLLEAEDWLGAVAYFP